ncbi:hypothetical protein LGN09_06265 [Burkholderia cenocepacia]|uniref:hypothetical protein n=1 Tax=Burkholderia cepacia complex TaxID=87882 RepID=UPI001B95CF36|nr:MULTISPECIES: hypothetical protein [Burkholderia cepacia complex]MBR8092496.1 hypothetical protein [Burkholderia cenocepacia]MCA8404486.1 hypothetical protein [Burkholderia cenocepacia]MDN7557079.1 hypothetical protein [Burkholderia orbicola]
MTQKHRPIAGFRIKKPSAGRGRAPNANRPIRFSQFKQLIDELITQERRDAHTPASNTATVAPDTRLLRHSAAPPQRKVFDVAPIDRSKSTLSVISIADAEARCRRETLLHFGLDPDL